MHFKKTGSGQIAFHNRSVSLSPRQRSAFILFDGKRTVEDVLLATGGLGVVMEDVKLLVALGLLEMVADDAPAATHVLTVATVAVTAAALPVASWQAQAVGAPSAGDQAHYSRAYPIATRLTAALGLRGFRLNLAVEAANDLRKLRELAPKIRAAVGPEKFQELETALYG